MKKILYFIMASLICVHSAESASRTENAISRMDFCHVLDRPEKAKGAFMIRRIIPTEQDQVRPQRVDLRDEASQIPVREPVAPVDVA